MQALYDLSTPYGIAPHLRPDDPLPALVLIEVDKPHRAGRARWWVRGSNGAGAGYTDQLDRAGLFKPTDSAVLDLQAHLRLRDDDDARADALVDARVLVGPACRLLGALLYLDAATDSGDDLATLCDPDDTTLPLLVRQYTALVGVLPPALLVSTNAEIGPDGLLGDATDVFLVPLEDLDQLRDALDALRTHAPTVWGVE